MAVELAEQATWYVTPNGTGTPEWQLHEGEIRIREIRSGDSVIVEVHDRLFEEPYRFGDQSLINDKVTDQIMVEAWQHFIYMMDSRQMGHTERYEIQYGGGRMSRMPHMLQCAALAVLYDGTNRDVLTMGVHDDPHRIWGHVIDAMLRSLGPHTAHDFDQVGFLERSGFVARLQAKGLCDEDGRLANGVHMSELAVRENEGLGIFNRPTTSKLPEVDRWGYNLMQESMASGGIARARAQLAAVKRVDDPNRGDQLVFDSMAEAEDFSRRQADRWYRYWASRENLVLSKLSQMLARHVLTVDPERQPLARPYQQYFPGDTLRGLAVDFQDTVLEMAKTDPGVGGLLKIMDKLAAHVRQHNVERDVYTPYQGPGFPAWALMHSYQAKLANTEPTVYEGRASRWLVIRSNAGKERIIDPFVEVGGSLERLHTANTILKDDIDRDSKWALQGFGVTIDLESRDLGLTPAERQAIKSMTTPAARKRWERALRRDEMSPEVLQAHIEKWNRRYRQVGALSVEPLVDMVA